MSESHVLQLALILVTGTLAQWIASRLRLPSILLLLGAGIVVGPVLGWLHPDLVFGPLLAPIVSISVGLILYEGGLSLRVAELRHSGQVIRNLVTLGAFVTWTPSTAAARWLLDLGWGMSTLLGAVLVVTGPTVIGPLLRHIRPTGPTHPILKWEGIVIDPIGATLALLVFEALAAKQATLTSMVVKVIVKTTFAGVLFGAVGAFILLVLLRRRWVSEALQSPMSLMLAVTAFVGANHIQDEAGLLASTVMGVLLANQRRVSVHQIVEFKENLRVLLIGGLFVILAARLDLSSLWHFGWRGLAFVAVLVLVVRPAAVFLSTVRSKLSLRERLFLCWMAPRGIVAAAVASIFGIRLGAEGIADASLLTSATFLVILCTVAWYGLTAGIVARRLGLAEGSPQGLLLVGAHKLSRDLTASLEAQGFRALLVDTNAAHVQAARSAGLDAQQGNVLDEQFVEDLDFAGIGKSLALTSNDEVNTLASLALVDAFGRRETYQLPPSTAVAVAKHLRGRIAFGDEASLSQLNDLLLAGASPQPLTITDPYSLSWLRATHGPQALPLFWIDAARRLHVMTSGMPFGPKPGDLLIALLSPSNGGA